LYEEAKKQNYLAKDAAKEEKRKEREANRKPAFLEVKDNEGRLASERILKNKGLLKKRKKIDRNSRVKHRRRFDKAQSKQRARGHLIR
jgi:U3 small nucleolar RNA-associated protein 3